MLITQRILFKLNKSKNYQKIRMTQSHKQLKLGPGVYVTDFRKGKQLKGVDTSQQSALTKDVGLMIDKVLINDSKINQLMFSNEAIMEEEGWETDADFLQAIQENYEMMLKFNAQIKQIVVELSIIKYKPETQKIEQLIDANRIYQRENGIQSKFNTFLSEHGRYTAKTNQMAEVSSESDEQNKTGENKSKQSQQAAGLNSQQKKSQDEGLYL